MPLIREVDVVVGWRTVKVPVKKTVAFFRCDVCGAEIDDNKKMLIGLFGRVAHEECGRVAASRLPTIGEWEKGYVKASDLAAAKGEWQ